MSGRTLKLPDLGFGQQPIRVSLWLADCGESVLLGDPIVEVLAGPAVVDLPAPASGVLVEILAEEDDLVRPGQPLAVIDCRERLT
ncbi:MAG TPA: biotin/lipoyl-binding protein [Planctomycetaceae bacterium]|nr:biotin/lipoyl-binding protein [Planctomycetaceae bacterium]HIQ21091.1 biotin/lipoyl-binding protein [Planctomycetota bacterium]